MSPKRPQKETVPPTLTPAQAIVLLQRQRSRAEAVAQAHSDDPQVDAWANSTENILNQAFGKPDGEWHANTRAFMYADGLQMFINAPDAHIQESHHVRTARRIALLGGFIEQLQDLAPPSATTAQGQYNFHSEIERVSGELYRSGHYKSAALEAYIRVIEQVRIVSKIPDDGDSLMNKAFACDKQTPIVQFNGLSTDADRDEQRGFLFLFKGIVGLRNSKAHSNVLFDDPLRGHDYLALASVLMRVLEIARVNPLP
jgi:uncharacterized protein (TIGR02391 family)